MPAMSPTMTEGSIAKWKVKEGDSFSTGDVLLEIETDKAQMDVEAQDDGKMAKITQNAGGDKIGVGARIAIIAEAEDDLSSLELPSEQPSQTIPSADDTTSSSASKDIGASGAAKNSNSSSDKSSDVKRPPPSPSQPRKQTYPLYPSIVQLLHENGLVSSEADKIPASGPKGRLLKGDVLAYLGQISSSYPSEQSTRIGKLGHLDLSNVRAVPPKEESSVQKTPPRPELVIPEAEPELDTEVAVPISLSSVLLVQKRISDVLGVRLPISTFVARATELANDELPQRAGRKPSTDELFNDVLGLSSPSISRTSRGSFIPQMTALPPSSLSEPTTLPQSQPDVYDMLTGGTPAARKRSQALPNLGIYNSKVEDTTNMFSVTAAKGNHTGYKQFKGTKASAEEISDLYAGLKQSYLTDFDVLLSGYAPSAEAVEAIGSIARDQKLRATTKPGSFFWVLDPVMGDEGRLYVNENVVPVYKKLLTAADLILPNQFELELLSEVKVNSLTSLKEAIAKLHKAYRVPHIIVTSIRNAESPSVISIVGSTARSDLSPRIFKIDVPEIDCFFSGTGDMFAALIIVRLREAITHSGLGGQKSWVSLDDVQAEVLPLAKAAEKVLGSMQAVLEKTKQARDKDLEQMSGPLGVMEKEKDSEKRQGLRKTKAAEVRVVRCLSDLREPQLTFEAHSVEEINENDGHC
ncbi:uncharacterized protein KY384_008300 [Bacidia gigantensis]|uniref:uncharacterized protein n=1 Tax=Bacidia gigantensis TaxID=2732470 RepID=UPI001D03CF4E|nr:uncharacterized protein KY384_008300 [Bacidia gigantensis]KAG8526871.1 hypothetical protein KY384_008300 [Bacidia gigantensis]